jgi:hypothetical protein
MPYVDEVRRGYAFSDQRWRQARAGTSIACLALLVVSCGSAGPTARADETTTAPEPPGASAQAVGPAATESVLVGFDDAAVVATWTTINDPVMGGLSTSTVTPGDGGLVFSGTISLENNGGFASARGPQDPDLGRRATGATSLRLRALGDGKTYVLKLDTGVKADTAGRSWSYIQRFATESGVLRSYELPIGGFQAVGMRLDPAPDAPQTLDPSAINRVSIYILDKQQGPFQLTVNAIDATT